MTNKRILLVEDDEFVYDLYNRVLTQANLIVDTAADGKSGLEKALTGNYDLILLDIMLPQKNGIEVLQELKTHENTKNVPVLILSNLGDEHIIKKCLGYGAAGYFIKANNSTKEIVERVNEFLPH